MLCIMHVIYEDVLRSMSKVRLLKESCAGSSENSLQVSLGHHGLDTEPVTFCDPPLLQCVARQDGGAGLGGSDVCHFCSKRVYVMERLSAEGFFFHRECFRCDVCSCTLRLGGHAFDSREGASRRPPLQRWNCFNCSAHRLLHFLSSQVLL